MKVIATICLLLFCRFAVSQIITFDKTEYDLGIIKESAGTVYHDFIFENTGDKPLIIKSILVSCGCSSSEWTKEAIEPGSKGRIRVSYHPQGRKEEKFTNIAEVYTNSLNYGTHKGVHNLYIMGKVIHDKDLSHQTYNLQQAPTLKQKIVPAAKDEFEVILNRISNQLLTAVDIRQVDSATVQFVKEIYRGGKWGDIDYPCFFRTNWEPKEHLLRVYNLTVSYTHPESVFNANDTLYTVIQDALNLWNELKPKCHNWYQNQITVPKLLGNILVLFNHIGKKLPSDLEQGLFGMMAWPDPRKWTGANKLDISMHHIQRGCLLKNDSIVSAASEQAFYPIRITNREGIREDISYQQHDQQLYIGAYGTVFVEGETMVAGWLKNTVYALKGEQLELLSKFVRETYFNVFRGPYLDFSVVGRGISRRYQLHQHGSVNVLNELQELEPDNKEKYRKIQRRFTEVGESDYERYPANKIFWKSDYALHNRPEYDFSVRTASVRTRKTESGNGENLAGGYLSDGATCIRVAGDEYLHIFPVWDWNKIPGVTAPQKKREFAVPWGEMGRSVFTGGVSDGQYGAMTFKMDDYGVKASKSWFFFDDEVVCLGAGIAGETDNEIVTCINQCLLNGNVETNLGSYTTTETKVEKDITKILHNDILYFFPEETKLNLFCGEQTGNWNKINYNEPDNKIKKNVFKLWVEHGKHIQNEKYAYYVVPGVKNIKDYNEKNVVIEANDTIMQAVYHKENDIMQIVFYQPSTFANKYLKLTIDIPCVVMIKGVKSRTPVLFIADPAQHAERAAIELKNKYCRYSGKVLLPEKELKGSSLMIHLENN